MGIGDAIYIGIRSHIRVACCQHRGEFGNFHAASLLDAGFFEVAVVANFFECAFAIEFFLEAAESFVNWLTFSDAYFGQVSIPFWFKV